MKDIMKKYKKHKIIVNINIVLASLILAFGMNIIFFDESNLSKNIKSSILNSNIQENKSDISLKYLQNKLSIISNKNINNLSSLSLSLIYNPENVDIANIKSNYGNIVNISNTPGITTLIINLENGINLKSGDKLIQLDINKKENITENINVINANFKDSNNEQFLLSTSGINF